MSSSKSKNVRLALSIAQTILLILTVAAVFFAVSCAISGLSVQTPPEGSEVGEQIGAGLSRGFSAVFFVIGAIAATVIAIPGEAVALAMATRSYGWGRVYGICAAVGYVLLLLICAVFWVLICINQA